MQAPLDIFSAIFVTAAALTALAGLFTIGTFIVDVLFGGKKHDDEN